MGKLKDLVRGRGSRSLHQKSKSQDERPDSRRSADMPEKGDKDLPAVSGADPASHQPGTSSPLRPSTQWGRPAQEKSPAITAEKQDTPVTPAPAVPDRDSSLRCKRASPPRIEEDYDRYRNMLAKSATGPQRMDAEIFHNASQEAQAPSSRTDQQKASREYGRRQIQATDGDDLDMQSLSVAGNGVDVDRASTEPVSVNESNSDTRRSPDPIAKKSTIPTRKALPSRPQGHALRHKPSDTDLQEQAQSQAQPSGLSKLERHPQPSPLRSTTNDSNHTSSPPAPQDPLARLPPSFNPTNTIDTTVDTAVAPAVMHETKHTQKLEIVQESISRDIHVDHYRHYVQPIKVVEVNPPQHFRINDTGEKVSMPAPEDWKMPHDLSVKRAPDFNSGQWSGGREASRDVGIGGNLNPVKVGWERRDYVVDEENPSGRILSAEELERERKRGHLLRPAGVGGRVSGIALSTPGHDNETKNDVNYD